MSVSLSDSAFGAATIAQCQAAEFSSNNQIEALRASAAVFPSEFVLMGAEPRFRYTSYDLATALTALDEAGGLYVGSGTISLPWRVRSPGSAFVSGANNIKLTATKGLLVPVSITAQQGQVASIDLEAALLSDGFTNPVGHSGSLSLSDPSYVGTFRLGPSSLGGSDVTGIVGIQVGFGINMVLEYADGGTFPTNVYVETVNPFVDVTFRGHAFLAAYGPMFSSLAGAVFSLVANADGGTIQSLSSSEHITLTLSSPMVDMQGISGQGTSIAEPRMRLLGKSLTAGVGVALTE
ncbi:hypothetical protein SH661x_003884 [Planctomicrobium sp. SH661]|uniref:hypothetical protein n=1 Tax=Planctomicrobium sp. SH661 TaxID=3448124 RepID=UPI003F5CA791